MACSSSNVALYDACMHLVPLSKAMPSAVQVRRCASWMPELTSRRALALAPPRRTTKPPPRSSAPARASCSDAHTAASGVPGRACAGPFEGRWSRATPGHHDAQCSAPGYSRRAVTMRSAAPLATLAGIHPEPGETGRFATSLSRVICAGERTGASHRAQRRGGTCSQSC